MFPSLRFEYLSDLNREDTHILIIHLDGTDRYMHLSSHQRALRPRYLKSIFTESNYRCDRHIIPFLRRNILLTTRFFFIFKKD